MREPWFWRGGLDPKSRQAAPMTRALLTPVAALYAWAGARRIRRATPFRPEIPVICVGNLTLGGAGKTPVCAALRARLAVTGLRAATLSRGWKGRLDGPLRVDPDAHGAADVGDEPLLLSLSGESWIGRDRPAAIAAMQADGVACVIMDDGHQNSSVAKALSLVVIDAASPFGNGHVFPKGPLREPVAAGLARADAVILMGDGDIPPAVRAASLPVLRAALRPSGPVPPGPLVAFAGIGRPDKFFEGLKAAGADLVDAVPYPDHHVFTPGELGWLARLAAERGGRLITTEKDFVRIPADQRTAITAFPVTARFDAAAEAALDDLLSRLDKSPQ